MAIDYNNKENEIRRFEYPGSQILHLLGDYTQRIEKVNLTCENLRTRTAVRFVALLSFAAIAYVFGLVSATQNISLLGLFAEQYHKILSISGIFIVLGLILFLTMSLFFSYFQFRRQIGHLEELAAAFEQLVGGVSQIFEQGNIDDEYRMVIRIRSIESELALRSAKRLLNRRAFWSMIWPAP